MLTTKHVEALIEACARQECTEARMDIDAIVEILWLSLTVMANSVFNDVALWNRFIAKLSLDANCAILKLSKLINLSIFLSRATIAIV